MKDWAIKATVFAQIISFILASVIIFQLFKLIFGGSWEAQEIITALVVGHIMITLGIFGYLITLNNRISSVNTNLNNKLSEVNTKIVSHLEWRKGRD